MREMGETAEASGTLEALLEVLTAVLAEICSDTSTTKTTKLLTTVEAIIKRVPGVYRVIIDVRDKTADIGHEVVYTNRAERENADAYEADASVYSIECFEITGCMVIRSTKRSAESGNLSKLYIKTEAEVMKAVALGVGRRIFELRRGRKNKLAAAQTFDELKARKTKFRETQEVMESLESARSVMTNEIEVLRKECSDLRSMLKQEQALSSESMRKLKTVNCSSTDAIDEMTREFKTREIALQENNRTLRDQVKQSQEQVGQLQREKLALVAKLAAGEEHQAAADDDMRKLVASFESQKMQSDATIADLQETIELKLSGLLERSSHEMKESKALEALQRADAELLKSKESEGIPLYYVSVSSQDCAA